MLRNEEPPQFDDFPHVHDVLRAASDFCGAKFSDARNVRCRTFEACRARTAAMRFYREAFPDDFVFEDVARFFNVTNWSARRACTVTRPDILEAVAHLLTLEHLRCPPPDRT